MNGSDKRMKIGGKVARNKPPELTANLPGMTYLFQKKIKKNGRE